MLQAGRRDAAPLNATLGKKPRFKDQLHAAVVFPKALGFIDEFRRCFKFKALAWSYVNEADGLLQGILREFVEVEPFRIEAAKQAIGILIGTTLIRSVGVAEIIFNVERLLNFFVLGELNAIVGGDGFDAISIGG